MKNLFDFATKELSQDAFLRWFFENYDDEQVGPIVVDFINHFTTGQKGGRKPFNLKYKDITELKTYAQVNDIDISVDFYCPNIFKGHRTIVIEDKTDTEEHHQLETYNKAIANWKYEDGQSPSDCVYKIFYKTHFINNLERERVAIAKWTPFGINEIYEFFIKYKDVTDSDVLNDYIEHIEKIHECYDKVSDDIASNWNSINWETFFNQFMDKYYGKSLEYYFTSFRNIYDSMIINPKLKNNSYLKYIAFEIQIRSSLTPYLHPSMNFGDKWKWSINSFKDEPEIDVCQKELEGLREFVQTRNHKFIKRSNTARAFAKINEKIPLNIKADELEVCLKRWIDTLLEIVDSYNKR